jgi:RNA polymerase sigma-70 factor (ECF subfamily)
METDELVDRARAGDATAFEGLVEPHRRELLVHCYRMLGSVQDAEDVLQETLVASWRGLAGFEGRASVRTWLYRIATNRCLNALRDGERRPRTAPELPPVHPFPEPTRVGEPVWLQPFPDALAEGVADSAPGPEARYESRETISLAFVTAVQALTPRQRAVLVLRDVLGFRAAEVAGMLDLTEDAVAGALKRARQAVPDAGHHPGALSARDRAVAARFADALEHGDVDAMVALLSDDALLTMPPVPLEYEGAAPIAYFMRRVALRDGTRAYRLVPSSANGQPAYGVYVSDHGDPVGHAHGMMVLGVAGGLVTAIVRFVDTSVMPYFGLPRSL